MYERDDLFVHMRLCSAWACVVSLPYGRQSNEIGLITHFSEVAFLHERLRAAYVAWLPAVPCVDRAGVDAADVRCEEHDVRGSPDPEILNNFVGFLGTTSTSGAKRLLFA